MFLIQTGRAAFSSVTRQRRMLSKMARSFRSCETMVSLLTALRCVAVAPDAAILFCRRVRRCWRSAPAARSNSS